MQFPGAGETSSGSSFVHVSVDDYSRLAYIEILQDEKGLAQHGGRTTAAPRRGARSREGGSVRMPRRGGARRVRNLGDALLRAGVSAAARGRGVKETYGFLLVPALRVRSASALTGRSDRAVSPPPRPRSVRRWAFGPRRA